MAGVLGKIAAGASQSGAEGQGLGFLDLMKKMGLDKAGGSSGAGGWKDARSQHQALGMSQMEPDVPDPLAMQKGLLGLGVTPGVQQNRQQAPPWQMGGGQGQYMKGLLF